MIFFKRFQPLSLFATFFFDWNLLMRWSWPVAPSCGLLKVHQKASKHLSSWFWILKTSKSVPRNGMHTTASQWRTFKQKLVALCCFAKRPIDKRQSGFLFRIERILWSIAWGQNIIMVLINFYAEFFFSWTLFRHGVLSNYPTTPWAWL